MGLREAGLGAGRMMGSVWGVVSVQGPRCMWEELSRGSWQSQVYNPVLWGNVRYLHPFCFRQEVRSMGLGTEGPSGVLGNI